MYQMASPQWNFFGNFFLIQHKNVYIILISVGFFEAEVFSFLSFFFDSFGSHLWKVVGVWVSVLVGCGCAFF